MDRGGRPAGVSQSSEPALPKRRQLAGLLFAAASLASLTLALLAVHSRIGLPSVLLIYLTLVVVIAVIGGWWPALIGALASSLLINWFFTPPTRTWTIGDPEHLLGLVVFVVVAIVVSVLVDREARAHGEAERRRAEARALTEVNELRTAILAAVSHDLRTPLASIKASVSSIREPDVQWSPEQTADFLETIETEADRLTSLVGNLLDMSRLQTGAVVLVRRIVGLDEVVPKALASLSDGGHSVDVDVPETLPRVRVDPELAERALANVVSNACQWTRPGTRPSIRGVDDGSRVELRVTDHGPGVPPSQRARMFEPFQRLGDRSSGNGVGLGLAVAHGFVEAMDGQVRVEETPGGGLTMVLSFEAER